jgi:hypothetical protein
MPLGGDFDIEAMFDAAVSAATASMADQDDPTEGAQNDG